MFSLGPKYVKLKTSLQTACNRLHIVQLKKSEQTKKWRKEIATCLKNKKYVKACIKAQRVIHEEALVESMELVQTCCEELLCKYGLFERMKEPDESFIQAVTSLIWVSPYMQADIDELKVISKQLAVKYGRKYARSCLVDQFKTVNPDLIERMRMPSLSDDKIEKCLREVSYKYDVSYDPDSRKKDCSKRNNSEYELMDNKSDQCPPVKNHSRKGNSDSCTELHGCGMNSVDAALSSKKEFNILNLKSKVSKAHPKLFKNKPETILRPERALENYYQTYPLNLKSGSVEIGLLKTCDENSQENNFVLEENKELQVLDLKPQESNESDVSRMSGTTDSLPSSTQDVKNLSQNILQIEKETKDHYERFDAMDSDGSEKSPNLNDLPPPYDTVCYENGLKCPGNKDLNPSCSPVSPTCPPEE